MESKLSNTTQEYKPQIFFGNFPKGIAKKQLNFNYLSIKLDFFWLSCPFENFHTD